MSETTAVPFRNKVVASTSLASIATLVVSLAVGQQPAGTSAPPRASAAPSAGAPSSAASSAAPPATVTTSKPTPPSAAPDTSKKDKARALDKYEQGVAAFGSGRFMDAIDLFLTGDAIASSPAFAYNIGVAYERLGDSAHALEWTRAYLRRDPDASDRPEAVERIQRHESRLMRRGVQQVTLLSEPAGATVLLDGRPVGVSPWTGEIAPGSHQASAILRGHRDLTQRFQLTPERALDVHFALEKEGAVASAAADRPPLRERGAGLGEVGPWTWAVLGTGLAGLGAGLALDLASAVAKGSALDATSPSEALADQQAASDLELGSRIAMAVGGAFTMVGAILVVVDLGSEDEPPALAIDCAPSRCGAWLRAAF